MIPLDWREIVRPSHDHRTQIGLEIINGRHPTTPVLRGHATSSDVIGGFLDVIDAERYFAHALAEVARQKAGGDDSDSLGGGPDGGDSEA